MDLRLQMLEWIAHTPRTYGETMDAWRSTCPRLSIWEDAVADDLVRVEPGRTLALANVTLTARGQSTLAQGGAARA